MLFSTLKVISDVRSTPGRLVQCLADAILPAAGYFELLTYTLQRQRHNALRRAARTRLKFLGILAQGMLTGWLLVGIVKIGIVCNSLTIENLR